jgi:hypothetical protein
MEEFFSEKQKEAINFFQENLNELISDPLYKLKQVIIYDNKVVGIFDTFEAALTEAVAKYPRDAFIIQQVVSDDEIVNFIYSAVS